MPNQLNQRLQQLVAGGHTALFNQLQHGIEKEGLRVDAQGILSQAGHPTALGSALTNGRITTDYSEALLEFITPVFNDVDAAIDYLADLHRFTYHRLDQESVWAGSMPCELGRTEDIPIARYGDSHIGRMKYIYRVGLEHRYGKAMQTIAGIHYNFSLPSAFWPLFYRLVEGREASGQQLQDFQSDSYFALIRNFRRYSWLLIYLFGASPALNRSFVDTPPPGLQLLDDETLYAPYATSLRMSDLGYSNKAQAGLNVCYNRLDNYINTLTDAISTPYPRYARIGLKDADQQYLQLNTNLLQIENEYYSDIRPKRVTESGEKPVRALQRRGVEYVEVRNLDINPYLEVGIDGEQARFLDTFLIFCLLSESPEIDNSECDRIKDNHQRTVWHGRDPRLFLQDGEQQRPLREWASSLLSAMEPVAALLDNTRDSGYGASLDAQRRKVADDSLTPSAQVLSQMQQQRLSHQALVLQCSQQHQQQMLAQPLHAEVDQELQQRAQQSLLEQQAIEQADQGTFDDFLQHYFAQ